MTSLLRFTFFLLLIAGLAYGQDRQCATMQLHQLRMATDVDYREKFERNSTIAFATDLSRFSSVDSIITIPVIVHVLYNSAEQNVSDEVIKSQIDVLNEDYGAYCSQVASIPSVWIPLAKDSKIRFCLAHTDPNGKATSGIKRYATNISSFTMNDANLFSTNNGGADAWPNTSYLNIWVAPLSNNILGFSAFPGTPADKDGVVIAYTAFGRSGTTPKSPYNLGRSATHEIGHWLSLRHIWGDDNGTCTQDDGIADTPKQSDNTNRCPSFPKTDACSPNSPGIMFMNFMDYTDDKCMSFFTNGQSTVMKSVLYGTRTSLRTSNGSNYTQVNGTEIGIDSVLSPVSVAAERCFEPTFRIRNYGTQTVAAIKFTYRLNDGVYKYYLWEDSIVAGETAIIKLSAISAPEEDRFVEIRMLLNDSIKADNYVTIGLRMGSAALQNCTLSKPSIYPNPVGVSALACLKTNYASSQQATVKVFDATGRVVFEQELELNSGDALPLQLQTLRGGLYIAEIRTDNTVDTVKFIYNPNDDRSVSNTICN